MISELQQELNDLGVDATVSSVTRGPSIDRYEVQLGRGVKVNKITSLEPHFTFVYGERVRISPIPGRRAVGVEVPHNGMLVRLQDVIAPHKDEITLGQSIDGAVQVDLDSLPHLLVAGATGSGKSVFINSVICELIMKNTPDTLGMVLIDPKRVELAKYNDLPHVKGRVVNDPLEADLALRYVIAEMERRYDQMEQAQVRHADQLGLPKLVVIIDELADLMMVSAKSVEFSISRITQLARAAGIHLIVATQRPSVEVVTGLIKANIPARLSFRTASAVDSRVILGSKGAEVLTGRGDALYRHNEALIRLRSPYVSESEIDRLVDHWT